MGTTTVGTTPVLALAAHKRRTYWSITMLPTALAAGNTGVLFGGKGFIPSTVVGNPDPSFILSQGGQYAQGEQYQDDANIFRGEVWLVASVAGQVVQVDEVIGVQAEALPVTPGGP